MIDATAIILTKNEEKNIADCLKSMNGFAKRCVIVDCGSGDDTVKIAETLGADVYYHEFEYYAKQFNWAIDNCGIDTEWIIRLDADERFTDELKDELSKIIVDADKNNIGGITIADRYFFLGREIKHGAVSKRKMMMFRRRTGRIEDRRRDAHSVISEGETVVAKNRFLHYDFKDIDSFVKKYNWYATREAMDYVDYINGAKTALEGDKKLKKTRNKKFGFYYKFPMFFRAKLWFWYNYYFRLGFLDGKAGKAFFFLECYWYRHLVDAKIYEYLKCGKAFDELKALE